MNINLFSGLFVLALLTSTPTLAQTCSVKGDPVSLLKSINHTDDVIDIDTGENAEYLSCIFAKLPSETTALENKIKSAYYDLIARDPQYAGADEFDEALW